LNKEVFYIEKKMTSFIAMTAIVMMVGLTGCGSGQTTSTETKNQVSNTKQADTTAEKQKVRSPTGCGIFKRERQDSRD
jgi:hypothetical protein